MLRCDARRPVIERLCGRICEANTVICPKCRTCICSILARLASVPRLNTVCVRYYYRVFEIYQIQLIYLNIRCMTSRRIAIGLVRYPYVCVMAIERSGAAIANRLAFVGARNAKKKGNHSEQCIYNLIKMTKSLQFNYFYQLSTFAIARSYALLLHYLLVLLCYSYYVMALSSNENQKRYRLTCN